jgi:hypothetical protein
VYGLLTLNRPFSNRSKKELLMLRKTIAALIVAAFAGVAGMDYAAAPAVAAMPSSAGPSLQLDSNVHLAKTTVYVKDKHGNRYKKKRKGYNHYYNGYYYNKPWWKSGHNKVWVYNSGKYGKRYKNKYPGYGYYYGGYWYPRPWWTY